jgi:hypothetical protein
MLVSDSATALPQATEAGMKGEFRIMADDHYGASTEKKNGGTKVSADEERQAARRSSDFKGVIFTPLDEPYLGRQSVFHFDQLISAVMETNSRVAPLTRMQMTDLQKAATMLIPQGISLSLGIRELVRQGYLFSAAVLLRPLMERIAIIAYLRANPSAIAIWESGWKFRERPSLAVMLQTISGQRIDLDKAKLMCDTLNHLVHGDPISSDYNLVQLGDAGMGYAPSKITNAPDVCDFVCFGAIPWLAVLQGMMHALFLTDGLTQ